ncbi:PREDICTED: histamine H1 receptor-like [Branchiostoma belcheri]|uniref:Histamine H1 receptor-like n=1 Tax=Branchiostoma belcheri TaxID=7741 RepID=A0A6P4YW00_BRABE|nr:PREDICTED: histamine H1 receptor-like [Branchiostoma belcheri]
MAFNITCQLTAAANSSSPLELLLPCNATGGPDVWSAGSLSPDGRLWRYTTTAVWKDTALGIVLACLCLVTCVGNAMVLHAVRTNKELQTVSNFFIVSLAVSDLVVGTGVMSLSTAYILAEEWRFGLALCQVWLSLDYVASTASIFNLFVLNLDRYWSVTDPLKYLRKRTKRRASVLISIVWGVSALWIVPIVGWHRFASGGVRSVPANQCDTEFHSDWLFKVVTSLPNFYLPMVLMVFLYARIYDEVSKRHKNLTAHVARPSGTEEDIRMNAAGVRRSSSSSPLHRIKIVFNGPTGLAESPDLLPKFPDDRERLPDFSDDVSTFGDDVESLPKFPDDRERESRRSSNLLTVDWTPSDPAFSSSGSRRSLQSPSREDLYILRHSWPESKIGTSLRRDSAGSGEFDAETAVDSRRKNRRASSCTPSGKSLAILRKLKFHSRIHSDRKAAKQLGMLIGCFLVCWLPYSILFMVVSFCEKCVDPNVFMGTIWLGYVNSTLNPFLYPLCNGNFRRAFRNMLRCQQQHTPASSREWRYPPNGKLQRTASAMDLSAV